VEIKQFKVKKAVPRARPGDSPVTIEFVASTPGTFPILCSEYCGTGHRDMTATLSVRAKPKGDQ
jgi:heme/copper-type cytochrome/quinol oxidase subunit 2